MDHRSHWDRVAPRYDAASAWLERRYLRRGREWVCRRAHGRVLEVGVGTGANLELYAADVHLTAVDTSEAMLGEARKKVSGKLNAHADGRSGPAHVDLFPADAVDLPFADGDFDAVVSTYVLCCVPDLGEALREAVRVLRPGGDLLLADHVVSTSGPARLVQRALETVTARAAGERFTRRPAPALAELGVETVASTRHTLGIFEAVHGVRH